MITMKRLFMGAAFTVVMLAGCAAWINTVNDAKAKAIGPEVMAASNAYFLYKKEPTPHAVSGVLRYMNTVQGRNYSILALRDQGEYQKIAQVYLDTMKTRNNSEIFQTFVYGIDIEVYYRQRLHGDGDPSSLALSAMSEHERTRILTCYTALRERYSYPWPKMLVSYLGKPLENVDNIFNIRSSSCQ